MSTQDSFIHFITQTTEKLNSYKSFIIKANCDANYVALIEKTIELTIEMKKKVSETDLDIRYHVVFQDSTNQLIHSLPYINNSYHFNTTVTITNEDLTNLHQQIKIKAGTIQDYYDSLEFTFHFFEKIGFLKSNIVAIGANGSGKTSLSNLFKAYLKGNGTVVSAQRILLAQSFGSISNILISKKKLNEIQAKDKTNKNPNSYTDLHKEFGVLLENLFAEHNHESTSFHKNSLIDSGNGLNILPPKRTKLNKTFSIWNSLIVHRTIDCNDGTNIIVEGPNGISYPIIQMSDGEKVILYLIAQVLLAPNDGFIVIDEPEMYLHKTILKKLWNILEQERRDCIFIYLTHDLDFATSRINAKKIWIKSFTHPDKWEIEAIPENEIPESLLLELLGSQKNILFVEGVKGGSDERIYTILFPDLTITPVGGCFEVINHTNAFNKLLNINTKAFGLIDSDHHESARLDSLEKKGIFSLKISELENLFLDESFLKELAIQYSIDISVIEKIKKNIIKDLSDKKESQAANYISAKINYYLQDTNILKGNNFEDTENNFNKFTNNVKIKEWYDIRIKELDNIINNEDYESAIKIFNNKGLHKICERKLKMPNFKENSIQKLQTDIKCQEILLKYFSEDLINKTASRPSNI